MSAVLLNKAKAFVRAKFTRAEVKDVKSYGGEFSAAEIQFKSFSCPAIFIATLGWSPEPSGNRLRGRRTRAVSMAAFIAFKHADREKRMEGAMNLAERLSLALSSWTPVQDDAPFTLGPVDADPSAENLYGRAVDSAGMALWVVRWVQDVKANADPGELFDLLRIDIEENYLPGIVPPAPAPGRVLPAVTDSIAFQQQQQEP
jgi:hypothetical protein